jgi:succinate-semialdehyde dehydrogenase/glutarate-semialdehyde dehydrogenase
MALLAGNGVLLKVASDTMAVGHAIAELFTTSGLPEGLFAYVNMPGRLAGPAFIDGGVDKLFFTGSTEVGKELMALAAPRLLPLVLELGGNDAAIVRSDADLDLAASGILWAAFSNAGQSCGGVQRALVHKAVYPDFCAKIAAKVADLRVGLPSEWESDIGSMTSAKQKRTVEVQLELCLRGGARVLAQASLPPQLETGNYIAPVVLADVPANSPLMREEIFGPVVAVAPVDNDEDALRIANDSPYGLTGSIWSRDRKAARALAGRMHAGAITINDHLMSHGLTETPWGGFGDSGLGRTHGEQGLLEMVRTQVVVDDILPGVAKAIWWHPYSERLYLGLRALIDFMYAQKLRRRLASIPRVVGVFLRYWEK